MKSNCLIILVVFTTMLIIGCGSQNVVSSEEVKIGMTVDKAISRLGEPELVTDLPNISGLAYVYKRMTLYVKQGIVILILDDFGLDDI